MRTLSLTAIGRIWFAGLVISLCVTSVSYGQATYQVVKGFDPPYLDGTNPNDLIQATDGSFYGTTSGGGPSGAGVVFKLDGAGTLTTLHRFTVVDGAGPTGVIQGSDGCFYGTTSSGGAYGVGTIFKLDGVGTLTTLHSFTDWAVPGRLIQASDGNFYGTTYYGGPSSAGTVFKFDGVGTLTTLYSFTGGSDGAYPGGVIQASDGNFYGTTSYGGAAEAGTVFKLDAVGTLTTLHSFDLYSDGAYPNAGVIQATDGNFYGTTSYGGAAEAGTVFKLDAVGTLTTLHTFTGGIDGAHPTRGMIQATDGSIYGTTAALNLIPAGPGELGTIFRLDAAGTLTSILSFSGPDGDNPSSLIQATDGSFYGTTSSGGPTGGGIVFKLDETLTVLHRFTRFSSNSDGFYPDAGVIQATDGSFYGTTVQGGANGHGTVFKLDGAGDADDAP